MNFSFSWKEFKEFEEEPLKCKSIVIRKLYLALSKDMVRGMQVHSRTHWFSNNDFVDNTKMDCFASIIHFISFLISLYISKQSSTIEIRINQKWEISHWEWRLAKENNILKIVFFTVERDVSVYLCDFRWIKPQK